MSEYEFEDVAVGAVRISELIEEVIQLDSLLNLHAEHGKDGVGADQYRDRRQAFLDELNELLGEYRLRIIAEEKAA